MSDNLQHDLLSSKKACPAKKWPVQRLSCLRTYLDTTWNTIFAQHREGASGNDVVASLTKRIDVLIQTLYAEAVEEHGQPTDYAVLAQGGFGRGALNPKSDIDLLFLFHKKVEEGDPITRAILHTLWDLRFEVGYSTRTLSECVIAAQDDTDSLTSMLEIRHLAGEPNLQPQLQEALARRFFGRRARGFIKEKNRERIQRHSRSKFSVQLLEPNVKESPGGLRDIHTAGWFLMARRAHKAPEGLLEERVLTRRNYQIYVEALDFHLRTRSELHFHTGKSFDVLEHNIQPIIAENLGYKDHDNELGVEHFMRDYYTHARAVKHISDLICERLKGQSSADRAVGFFVRRELDDGSVLYRTHLGLPKKRRRFFDRNPRRLLSLFLNAQRFDVSINEAAQQAIKDHLHLIDDKFRSSSRASRIFLNILHGPVGIGRTLRAMHELDVLGAYVPEFGSLTCLVQYNRYHIYTADEHTLVALENLDQLTRNPALPHDLQHLRRVFNEIPRKELLYLALLMHDVGKSVRGEDHSTVGAEMTHEFLTRLGLPKDQIETVVILVRQHLTMSDIAQRRDLSDQAMLSEFASIFSHPDVLRMLYLLTYADLSAVTQTAWTSWKGHLLRELYEKIFDILTRSEQPEQPKPQDIQALIAALGNQIPRKKLVEHLNNMPPRYSEQNSPEEIAHHLQLIDDLGSLPIAVRLEPSGLFTEITISTYDQPFRLSEICGVLATHDINIFSAQAYTRQDGIVIDIFQVSKPDEETDPQLRDSIQQTLTDVFRNKVQVADLFASHQERWSRRHTPTIPIPVEVIFENDVSARYTVIDITAQDATGLLYSITRTLSDLGLEIYTARIGTQADRAVDAFYVHQNGEKITDSKTITHITQALATAMDS
ncbi:MAG: [protein-PII] uridylyltransferase [Candidatus Latescibacteria bacterium]|nr:[protein-PII] uridylyltransferase [Candidatus Latescibacterota bacterium]